jgi:hypothetical protein
VVLRPGGLNRQFDQVAKDVGNWPEWMKRAAESSDDSQHPQIENRSENSTVRSERAQGAQESLNLK